MVGSIEEVVSVEAIISPVDEARGSVEDGVGSRGEEDEEAVAAAEVADSVKEDVDSAREVISEEDIPSVEEIGSVEDDEFPFVEEERGSAEEDKVASVEEVIASIEDEVDSVKEDRDSIEED